MLYKYLRMAAATAVIATTMPLSAMNQDVDGKVTDENGQPLPNVNVVLLSPDSTFVQGTVTDEQGSFLLPTDKKDATKQDKDKKK